MGRKAWMYGTLFLAILLVVPLAEAGDCRYGSVHAWFQGSTGMWQNATAHPILTPGQEFQIKITVRMTTACRMFFLKLHEFGTPVYEVVAGPMRLEELLSHQGWTQANRSYTYTWTLRVRPTSTWTRGNAPLEVFAQLNSNDTESCVIDFDVINAYIQPGYPPTTQTTPAADQHLSPTAQGPYVMRSLWREALLIVFMLCLILSLHQQK